MESNVSNENKLKEIKGCINEEDSLYCIPRKEVKAFEEAGKKEGRGTIPIMTYGEYIIYLKADCSLLPKIPLSNFNYTSGTFEKKWGPDHKTIVLTPNHSSVRKVEIEIQGMEPGIIGLPRATRRTRWIPIQHLQERPRPSKSQPPPCRNG
jgi:hypothetical protein